MLRRWSSIITLGTACLTFSEALPSPIGQAGVDLFFVISGFIMVVTTWSRPASSGGFMLRRVIRIAPTYWIYTTLLAAFVLAFPSVLRLEVTPAHFLYSMLFIPHVSPLDQVAPLLQPGWTLNYEMFFYCAFAVSLFASAAYRVVIVTVTLAGLIVAGVAISTKRPGAPHLYEPADA